MKSAVIHLESEVEDKVATEDWSLSHFGWVELMVYRLGVFNGGKERQSIFVFRIEASASLVL
jgi:hypothetical protein